MLPVRLQSCLFALAIPLLALAAQIVAADDDLFRNFETPQVHPLDVSPSGMALALANTANGTIDLFSLASGTPIPLGSVPVGVDPVSVRFRGDAELWAINHISDSVSIIDPAQLSVVRTLLTLDEPTDVVFSANSRAFVCCSQANKLLVYDLADLDAAPVEVRLHGEDPRALALSTDGLEVYAAIFESGNRSTLLAHDVLEDVDELIPDRVVSRPDGPHGGVNPPFNGTGAYEPPLAPGLPTPPPTDLIVKQDTGGAWRDDTGADWTRFVSGTDSEASGRVAGWELADNDVAVIDAATLDVSYLRGMMNLCMAIAVRPGGEVTVVGTDAMNEVRFEPKLQSHFVRSMLAVAVPPAGSPNITDMNSAHLDYNLPRIPPEQRALSVGDPRAIAWDSTGATAYIAGMGSNNITRMTPAGARIGLPLAVDAGPTGIALDEARDQLYVLCRFEGTLLTIDLSAWTVNSRVPLYDPTPAAIRDGRPMLYDTHASSGLGQVSCGSCHADARTDQLAWDLGNPQGAYRTSDDRNIFYLIPQSDADNYHPMKGPRTTQTLQDVIGKEPFHWSGDRDGIEAFSATFRDLMGTQGTPSQDSMDRLKQFLKTIHVPPNPNRNLDNSLKTALSFDGELAPAPIGDPRLPLPDGNPQNGLQKFMSSEVGCVLCHTLPSGRGTAMRHNGSAFESIAAGPNGVRHLRVVTGANTAVQRTYKMPPLAPVYEKVGLDFLSASGSTHGFGILAAGAIDSPVRFAEAIGAESNLTLQDAIDIYALLLSWGGSGFVLTNDGSLDQPPGTSARDSHAALGAQLTLRTPIDNLARLTQLLDIVEASPRVELIAKGLRGGTPRGWWYTGADVFAADAANETTTTAQLVLESGPGSETTFTVVAGGTGLRLGIDRDLDGVLDSEDGSLDPVELNAGDARGGCPECEESGVLLVEGGTLCLFVDLPGATLLQWSHNGIPLQEDSRITGASCDRLRIDDVSFDDAGEYRVDFDDGAKAPQSMVFTVQVNAAMPAAQTYGLALLLVLLCLAATLSLICRRHSLN